MTTTLIEPRGSADALGTRAHPPHLPDSAELLAGLPPLLSVVPQAGPSVFAYAAFGAVLLLLLVPPITLHATLGAVALVVAAALAAVVVLAGAILEALILLVRLLRRQRLRHVALAMPHFGRVRARRV